MTMISRIILPKQTSDGLSARLLSLLLLAVVAISSSVASVSAATIDRFGGRVGEESSWFDSTLWPDENGQGNNDGDGVPTSEDVVWIDEPSAYAAIDDPLRFAEAKELVVGRTAASSSNTLESVQLDLLADATLDVAGEMRVGHYFDSDGTVYASKGSKISVGGTLRVGDNEEDGTGGGRGLVVLGGNAKIVAAGLEVATKGQSRGSAILMDDDATIKIVGGKSKGVLGDVEAMVANGSIKPLKNNGGNNNKSIKVVTKSGNVNLSVVSTPADTPAPTAAPTKTGNIDIETSPPTTAPAPFKCENSDGKVKYVNPKGKTKKTTCKKAKKKCNKKDKDGVPVWQSCPVKCKKCDELEELLLAAEDIDIGNDDHNIFCKDSKDLQYKNKEEKDCEWVRTAETNKCDLKWKGTKLSEHCPNACGVC